MLDIIPAQGVVGNIAEESEFLTCNSKFFIDICFFLIHTLCDFVENAYICSVIIDKLIEGNRSPG